MVGWARSHRLGWAAEEMRKLIFSFLLFRACGSSMKEGVSRDPSSDLRAILLISRTLPGKRLVEQRCSGGWGKTESKLQLSGSERQQNLLSKFYFMDFLLLNVSGSFFLLLLLRVGAQGKFHLSLKCCGRQWKSIAFAYSFWGEKIRSKWIIIGTIVRKKKKTYCHKYISFVRQVTQREKKLPQKKCSSQRQLGGKRETSQQDRFLLLDSKSHNTINGENFCLHEESYPDVPANVSILRSNF